MQQTHKNTPLFGDIVLIGEVARDTDILEIKFVSLFRSIFMEDHLKFWKSHSIEIQDKNMLLGRQISNSMRWNYCLIVFHKNTSKLQPEYSCP